MSSPIPKNPIKFLWHVSQPHGRFAIFAILMATLGQISLSLTLYPFKEMTDGFIAANDAATMAEAFVTAAGAYALLTALSFLFWRLYGFIGMEWLTPPTSPPTKIFMTMFLNIVIHTSLIVLPAAFYKSNKKNQICLTQKN